MRPHLLPSSILLLSVLWTPTLRAQDWPQWRGPARDGVAAMAPPATWPEKLQQAWQVPVGTGHASPIVQGEHVYVLAREGKEEVVRRLGLNDGEIDWRTSYPAPYTMNTAAIAHGKGPKSTPALADGRLFTLGIDGILSAFLAVDGKLLWQKTFASDYKKTSPLYGAAASPLVDRGAVIVHVGGHHDGALTAFEVTDGRIRWRLPGDGPGYTSPIVVETDGTRQIVTQTDQHVMGVDANTGELLWKIPFTTAWDQNVITPVAHGELVIFSGLDQPLQAWKLIRDGGRWKPREVWQNDLVPLYMSSPVVVGNRLFGMSHKRHGQFFALDTDTGKTLWTAEGRGGENAAIVAAGEHLLLLNDDAELVVLPVAADGFEPVARYQVADSPTWAHPVPTPAGILIKDKETLSLWRFEAPAPSTTAKPETGR